MFKCLECGHLFEDGKQKKWVEDRGEFWGHSCSENFSGCPMCEGDYEEVKPCVICGSYNHNIEDEFCDECKMTVKKRFENLMKTKFTKEERELLNELYDGERI